MMYMSLKRIVTMCIALAMLAGCSRYGVPLHDESGPWQYPRRQLTGGSAIDGAYDGRLDVIWNRDLGEKPQGPLVYTQNTIVSAGAKKRLIFVDPQSGEVISKLKMRACPQSGGLWVDSLIYTSVAPPFNYIECYRVRDGERKWRGQILDVSAPMVAYDEKLIVCGGDGVVYCLNRFTSDLIWEQELQARSNVTPCISTDSAPTLWVALANGELVALSMDDGEQVTSALFDGVLVASPAVRGSDIYVTTKVGNLYRIADYAQYLQLSFTIDVTTLAKWRMDSDCWVSPAVSDDAVVTLDNSGGVYCFTDPSLSELAWKTQLPSTLIADPIIVGDYVIVGGMTGWIWSLNLMSGEIHASRELDHEIRRGPISDGARVYVGTSEETLYCLGHLERPVISAAE